MSGIYFRPVVPILVSLMIGIGAGCRFPDHRIWPWVLSIIGLGMLFFLLDRKRQGRLAPLFLFFVLGYLSIQPWMSAQFPLNHIVHFRDASAWKIEGTVASKPIVEHTRIKFILDTQFLSNTEQRMPVIGRIAVSVYGKNPELTIGDVVAFRSRIRAFRNFNNPGGFDYKQYMAFKNIWGAAYTSGMRLSILNKGGTYGISGKIDTFRGRVSSWLDRRSSGAAGGVLKALIIGDRSRIPPAVRDSFYRTGIGHILAISGLHIGIVATASFLLFKWLFSRITFLLWRAWTRKAAAAASLAPVILYGMLAGMSPSTQRAVVMVSLFLLSFLIEREHDTISAITVAALLILAVHPPSLFSISFQLSFVAVSGILVGFIVFGREKPKRQSVSVPKNIRFLFWIRSFFLASLFAVLGTLPLVMYYFNQVSLIGLLANLVAIPIIGFVVVPLGLLAVFLSLFNIPLADGCIRISLAILDQAIHLIHWMSNFAYAAIKTFTPTVYEIVGYYVLVGVLLFAKRKGGFPVPVKIAVGIILFFFLMDSGYWLHHRYWHKDLRVTVIDVGQGTAGLLELPGGKTVMVDGGGFSDNASFDVGEKIIAPLLRRKRIGTLDTLILTHPDSDHINGFLHVTQHFHVKQMWTNGESVQTSGYRRLLDIIENEKIRFPEYGKIPKHHEFHRVEINILYPPDDFLAKGKKHRWRNTNNNSLVLQVRYGTTAFLFPGDIMEQAEEELIEKVGSGLKSTVLLAPHHGGRNSSTPRFIQKVSPQWVVVSSGWKNRFGFPHPSIIAAYRAHGCRLFNTATHGAITFRCNGKRLKIETQLTPRE